MRSIESRANQTSRSIEVDVRDSSKVKFSTISPPANLTWHQCFEPSRLECAKLDVPLDYEDPTGPRASIPLLKLPASSEPYQGMVLYNPGGPGATSIDPLLEDNRWLDQLSDVIGKTFDIVAWDPRGIGNSFPLMNCTPLAFGKAGRNRSTEARSAEQSDGAFEEIMEVAEATNTACQGDLNEAGSYMSTVVVAKDIAAILDSFSISPGAAKLPDASLLNYWGCSYGTFIGQTFAPLYPD
ncbi:hypothetical protein EG329_010433 [Mollisiaceae sp. DMI_Dod_QoI]|nr:hypothetical protein EG329_010433 [Helotiales sp. DMI_Dod_QoI]